VPHRRCSGTPLHDKPFQRISLRIEENERGRKKMLFLDIVSVTEENRAASPAELNTPLWSHLTLPCQQPPAGKKMNTKEWKQRNDKQFAVLKRSFLVQQLTINLLNNLLHFELEGLWTEREIVRETD
jgi:hypothetical protein